MKNEYVYVLEDFQTKQYFISEERPSNIEFIVKSFKKTDIKDAKKFIAENNNPIVE